MPTGEKTEAPTGKRLNEARSRGQVARSLELNTAAALLVGFMVLRNSGVQMFDALQTLMRQALASLPTGELTGADVRQLIVLDGLQILPSMSTILLTLLVTGVVVTVVQTGPMWASKNIGFDAGRLNPLTGLKRIFSPNGLVELLRAILKLIVVGVAAYTYLTTRWQDLLTMSQPDLMTSVIRWADLAYNLGLRVGGAYIILASADYLYKRWDLMRNLKMTKEEVKEEAKQQEGNPLIKAQVRQRARRLARMRMMKKVPQADVVITNPTHFAVALQYQRDSMGAPRVVAKGAALIALRIREIAKEHNVPIVENPPVARALYSTVDIEEEVPPELYVAVAEVFAFIYNMKSKRRPPLTRSVSPSANPWPAAAEAGRPANNGALE
jgi:flagellar biosynthesis protein FlhB